MECIFCKIVAGEVPSTKVFENDALLAFMDIKPINEGHVLIIPKKHAELIEGVEEETVGQMFKLAQKLNTAIRSAGIKSEGINYFLADGEVAGQEVFHVHLHVFPRFKNDGFGFNFPASYDKLPSRQELEEAANKIKTKI